jgi:hypothetical protein
MTLEVCEKGSTNRINKFLGTVFDKATISWKKGEVINCTADLIVQDVDITDTTPQTVSYPSTEPFKWSQVNVTVNGSEVITNEGSIVIMGNHLAEGKCDDDLGRKISQPMQGEKQYTIKLNIDKPDNSLLTLWKNLTSHTVVISFTRSATDKQIWTFSNCVLDSLSEPVDLGSKVIVQDGTWFPQSLSIVVTDAIATYP